MRTGLAVAALSQGLYWLGVALAAGEPPAALLGAVLSQGYGWALWAMTGLGLAVAGWSAMARRRGGAR